MDRKLRPGDSSVSLRLLASGSPASLGGAFLRLNQIDVGFLMLRGVNDDVVGSTNELKRVHKWGRAQERV